MFNRSRLAVATQAAILSLSAMPAFAEEANDNKEQQLEGLEKITVTSRKRVQSIQEIPTSIQAFSGQQLEDNNVSNLLDMSEGLPNVHISETSSSKRIVVRGIGSGTNAGFEQSVAMYKDGLYLGRGHQAKFPFLDMQRVELVKGPQAIMFGKNATAGAVSMISQGATDEFEGNVSAEIGSDNEQRISAVLNMPVTDDFAIRFAAFDESIDGYIRNEARNADEASTSSNGFRVATRWQINDKLDMDLKWEHGEFESTGSRYQYIIDGPNRDAQITLDPTNLQNVGYRTMLLSDTTGLDYTSFVSGDGHPGGLDEGDNTELDNVTLQFNYQNSGYEFTSITTHSQYDWHALFDADYSELPLIKQSYIEEFEQFSQEFRIASPLGQTLEYVAGVYYLSNELTHPNDVLLGAGALFPDLAGISIGVNAMFEQEQKSYSAFAAFTWNISEDWKANLGIRYQDEEKTVTSLQSVYTLFPDGTPDIVQAGVNEQAPGIAFMLSGANIHQLADSRSESHTSPNVSIEYHGFEDTMLFASVGTGSKAGGYDGSGLNGSLGTTIDPNSGFEYEDEEATNFEFGIKSSPIKNKLELNATLFNTDYENLQVSEFNGNAFVVKNAAEAQVKGIELDTRWYINDNFDLTASLALLDFEYKKFDAASPTVRQSELLGQSTQDLTGKTGAFAPEYSGNIALNHQTEIFGGYLLSSSLSVQFSDEFYLEQDLDPIAIQDAYQKVNLRIEIANPDDNFTIALFAKNLTDEQTFGVANDVPVMSYAHRFLAERPRSYHLQATYRF